MNRLRQSLVRVLKPVLVTAMALLFFTVLWQVVTRYSSTFLPFVEPSQWTEEFAIYLLIWISLLGAAVVYEENAHLGVDYLVAKFGSRARRWTALFAESMVLLFIVSAMIVGGWRLMRETLEADQLSPALGWKIGYVYAAVPLAGLLMLAFNLAHLLDLWRGRGEPATRGGAEEAMS